MILEKVGLILKIVFVSHFISLTRQLYICHCLIGVFLQVDMFRRCSVEVMEIRDRYIEELQTRPYMGEFCLESQDILKESILGNKFEDLHRFSCIFLLTFEYVVCYRNHV